MISSPYSPAAGRFLVSEPFMEDQNFQRTVVLLTEHTPQGSLGFVLNRRLQVKVPDVMPSLHPLEAPVFLGGPVEQTTLHYVHRLEQVPGANLICDGVYWSGSFEALQDLAQQGQIDPADVIFFVGYSGWGAGQLEAEMARKAWIVAPATKEFIFQPEQDDLWRQALQTLGGKYKVLSNYPTDPKLN
jgi:putative transcriptional regulator